MSAVRRPRLLISARDEAEALMAAAAGADIVDLKEPSAGALGAVPLAVVRDCVAALAGTAHRALPVSATVGDWPADALPAVLQAAQAVADCGVTWVKVGIAGRSGAAGAALIAALQAALPGRVVPVLLADQGVDAVVLDAACAAAVPALMLDTATKAGGSLLDALGLPTLRRLANRVQAAGVPLGLAGSLRAEHIAALLPLGPAILGFRGAACEGGRTGRLAAAKVRALRDALASTQRGPLDTCLKGNP